MLFKKKSNDYVLQDSKYICVSSQNDDFKVFLKRYSPCVWKYDFYCAEDKQYFNIVTYEAERENSCDYLSDSNLYDIIKKELSKEYIDDNNIPAKPAILIESDTGSGKTTFIIKNFVLNAATPAKRVLILVNRVGLACQLKRDILECFPSAKNKCENFIKHPDFLDKYVESIENIDIMTIQKFSNCLSSINFSAYSAVIIDEAHYFISDAVFNGTTEKALKAICQNFKKAARIYLTATPKEVGFVISEHETKVREAPKYNCFTYEEEPEAISLLHFKALPCKRNYRIKTLNKCENYDKLADELAEAMSLNQKNSEDKALIFVASKKLGLTITNKFSKLNVSACFIDKNSKKEAIFEELINDSCFTSSRVLVTTSVAYNGINIKDKKLLHIAVLNFDEVEFLQSIGRVRVDNNTECVNIYIYNFSKKYLSSELNCVSQLLSEYKKAEGNENLYCFQHLGNMLFNSFDFDYSRNCIVVNKLAYISLEYKKAFLEKCLSEIDNNPNFSIAQQLSWLKGFVYDNQVLGYSKAEMDFITFLKESSKKVLTSEEKSLFFETFKDKAELCGYKEKDRADRKDDKYTERRANNLLEKIGLPFELVTLDDKGKFYLNPIE